MSVIVEQVQDHGDGNPDQHQKELVKNKSKPEIFRHQEMRSDYGVYRYGRLPSQQMADTDEK